MSHFGPIGLTVCSASFLLGLGLTGSVHAPGDTVSGIDIGQTGITRVSSSSNRAGDHTISASQLVRTTHSTTLGGTEAGTSSVAVEAVPVAPMPLATLGDRAAAEEAALKAISIMLFFGRSPR